MVYVSVSCELSVLCAGCEMCVQHYGENIYSQNGVSKNVCKNIFSQNTKSSVSTAAHIILYLFSECETCEV